MGYELIPLIASVLLAVRYLAVEDASHVSKFTVVAIVVVSLAITHYWPLWFALATVLQSGVSIYMLFYAKRRASAAP